MTAVYCLLIMNTLGYVARQFDVLASAKPSPSSPDAQDNATHLHRVSSENWSSSSFLFPQPMRPRRSKSSPSIHKSQAPPPTLSTTPTPPLLHTDTLPPRSKQNLESVINQIFFIRVFLVVWDNLKVAWSSLVEHVHSLNALTWRRALGILEAAAPLSASARGKARADREGGLELEVVEETSTSASIHARLTPESSSRASTPIPSATSRSGTPVLNAKKSPFHLPKTLVLDLDETLIHSTSRPMPSHGGSGWFGLSRKQSAGHMIEVVLGGRSTLYHVYKRPFVDFFLRTVSLSSLPLPVSHSFPLPGFRVVHAGHIHGLNARVRGSRH